MAFPNFPIKTPVFFGVGFISCASLLFELSLSRYFSISLWHHFAFMVVSIALLGLGASGTFLMFFPSLAHEGKSPPLVETAFLFACSILISYLLVNRIPLDPTQFLWNPSRLLIFLLYYMILSWPFFFSGLTISMALTVWGRQASKIYFSDLAGAGLGALIPLMLYGWKGHSGVVMITSLLGVVSAFCFFLAGKNTMRSYITASMNLLLGILLVLWTLSTPAWMTMAISPVKDLTTALRPAGSRILETRWNGYSRLDIISSTAVRSAPGLSLMHQDPLPPQLGMSIDAGNLQSITGYSGDPAELDFTDSLPSALPYHLSSPRNVLVLNIAGGLPLLLAHAHGASTIQVTEPNVLISDTFMQRWADHCGWRHLKEGTVFISQSGRNYLRSSDQYFDLIDLWLPSPLGATATGLYHLSEDYLLTEEAIGEYLEHLSSQGFLSITTYLLVPPRAGMRSLSLVLTALESLGTANPSKQVLITRSWGTLTILVKGSSISGKEIEQLKGFCSGRKFDLVYYPGMKSEEANRFNRFPEPIFFQMANGLMDPGERNAVFQESLFDLRPVTDDRPFFYHFLRASKIRDILRSTGGHWQILVEGGYLVPIIFFQAFLLGLVLVLLPGFLLRGRMAGKRESSSKTLLPYFFFIAVGFMFIEISLIQKFILLFHHPAYAITAVISLLLLFSGIGSFISRRTASSPLKRIKLWIAVSCGAVLLIAFIFPFILPPLFRLLGSIPLWARLISTVCILAPLGCFMGIPFPLGITLLARTESGIIPWAWSINGCTSVLGAVGATMLALAGGFSAVLYASSIFYGLALLWVLYFSRK